MSEERDRQRIDEIDPETSPSVGEPIESATLQSEQMSDEVVKQTGRGFLVITAAKLWFMVTGAMTQLGLPLFFGSAELFGQFKIVTEAIGLLNMVMITGTLQAVAKVISEQPSRARELVNQALKLQLLLGLPVAIGYALASPFIATEIFHDGSLAGLMRFSSLIIAFYAFYALFVGYLNGIKSFVRQAALDIAFQTMKTVGMLGLVWIGFGVGGAVAGFVGAAGAIALISGVMVWRMLKQGAHLEGAAASVAEPADGDEAPPTAAEGTSLLKFLLLVMAYTFALNGLLRVDLFMLKSITSVPYSELTAFASQFQTVSDKFAGFYGAALNISRLPYQGVIAITFVVFPLISEATFQQDRSRTIRYIETTFRYCLLLIAAVALPLIFSADSLIGALYSPDYRAVASALAIMTISIIFFSLFFVAATIITGAGRPGVTAILMGVSLALSSALNWWFLKVETLMVSKLMSRDEVVTTAIRWGESAAVSAPGGSAPDVVAQAIPSASYSANVAASYLQHGPDFMSASAAATAIAMAVGCLLSLIYIWLNFRALPPWKTMLRVAIGAAALFGLDLLVPDPGTWFTSMGWMATQSKIVTLCAVAINMAILGLTFLLVMGVTGEITREEIARLMAIVLRKKKKSA